MFCGGGEGQSLGYRKGEGGVQKGRRAEMVQEADSTSGSGPWPRQLPAPHATLFSIPRLGAFPLHIFPKPCLGIK